MDIHNCGEFIKQLRSEGFDARSDVFNGQVGVIVGPKGLDARRMPPDEIGIFHPLWELNDPANQRLVFERRFHDIAEKRQPGWTPFQNR
jgi:hypothetical protein